MDRADKNYHMIIFVCKVWLEKKLIHDNFSVMNACVEEKKLTKGERTAQNILNVSERLFAEKGFRATSLREVASEVGIREPGLYRYFKSKDELYQQVLERALRPLSDTMDDILVSDAGQYSESLPVVMFDMLSQSPHVAILLQQAMAASGDVKSKSEEGAWLDQWLSELIGKGRALFRHMGVKQEADEFEVTLYIISLFNLCTGYFSSAKALEQLSQQSAFSEKSLQAQRQLLNRVAQSILE